MGSVYILYREKQVTYGHGDSEKVRVIQTYETVKDRWISHHPYPAFESEEEAQHFIDTKIKDSRIKIMKFQKYIK
jgi:hypothetical protein